MRRVLKADVLYSICLVPFLNLLVLANSGSDQPENLLARIDGSDSELWVSDMKIDIQIDGLLAHTEVFITVKNESFRSIEGVLDIFMPDNAMVCGYALDINGKMVDGVAVERVKAKQAYETIVFQKIDPGLAEWKHQSHFQTRIFPILNTRQVRISFVSTLSSSKGHGFYTLPLKYNQEVDNISIHTKIAASSVKPEIISSPAEIMKMQQEGPGYRIEITGENVILQKDMIIKVPESGKYRTILGNSENEATFFCIHGLPGQLESKRKNKQNPNRITILWDTSYSRSRMNHEPSFKLLQKFFSKLRSSKIQLEVVLFSFEIVNQRKFSIRKGNTTQLIKYLKQIPYDGGTRFDCLVPLLKNNKPDLFLLFSDGKDTFTSEQLNFKAPVFTVSTTRMCHDHFLNSLSAKSGGSSLNLATMDLEDASQVIGKSPFSLLAVNVIGGQISDLVPNCPVPVQGPVFISGKLISQRATVELLYGYKEEVLIRVPLEINRSQPKISWLKSFWASQKVNELLSLRDRNREFLYLPGTFFLLFDACSCNRCFLYSTMW